MARRLAGWSVVAALVLALAACTTTPTPAPSGGGTTPSGVVPSGSPSSGLPGSGGGSVAGSTPKPYLTGLLSRSGPPTESELTSGGKPLISGYVIQAYWNQIQPTGPDDFDTSSIDSQLAFAKAHDLGVRLRVYAGYSSPGWVLRQVGSVGWHEGASEAGPATYDVPKFWTSAYQQLFAQFDARLAERYDAVPQVREVVAGMCTTKYAEPFIRQFNVPANVVAAKAAGYTDALNDACLRRTIDVVATDWHQTSYDMAFNPYQSVDGRPAGVKGAAAVAAASLVTPKAIAQYCIEKLGPRCVLGNNSVKGESRGAACTGLYDMLRSLQAPIYIQTAGSGNIGDYRSALTAAVALGALSIELPDTFPGYDASALTSAGSGLDANAQRLLTAQAEQK